MIKYDNDKIEYREKRDWQNEIKGYIDYYFREYDKDYNRLCYLPESSISSSLEIAMFFTKISSISILFGLTEYERKYNEIAYKYAEIALQNNYRKIMNKNTTNSDGKYKQYITLATLYWYMNNEENNEYMNKAAEFSISRIEEVNSKPLKKSMNLDAIVTCIKCEQFEQAKELLDVYYKRKKNQNIDSKIMYDQRIFYDYLLEYLLDINANRELQQKLNSVFLTFFEEVNKNNWTLRLVWKSDMGLADIYYFWYKYIQGIKTTELTASNIYKSIRYGVFFWNK